MRVALGTFACSGLEAHLGPDIPAGMQAALSQYASKLQSGRKPLDLPLCCQSQTSREQRIAFDLMLDKEVESALEKEAVRQGTTASQLAVHSVLIYLAELDFLEVPPRSASGNGAHTFNGTGR